MRLKAHGGGMLDSDNQTVPSAPSVADPMVTPSSQSVYIEPAPQINPARPSQSEDTQTAAPAMPATPDSSTIDPDLAQIKQQALQSLSPLVGQLDQTPDEKFKTIMMLIQASDNPKMLKDAYAAAGQITDEKVRAQALLDIINEVNYFSQQQKQ